MKINTSMRQPHCLTLRIRERVNLHLFKVIYLNTLTEDPQAENKWTSVKIERNSYYSLHCRLEEWCKSTCNKENLYMTWWLYTLTFLLSFFIFYFVQFFSLQLVIYISLNVDKPLLRQRRILVLEHEEYRRCVEK